MKILLLIFILYIHYCICQYIGLQKKNLNPYPKKVGSGIIQYNNAGKYVKSVPVTEKKAINAYTVFAKPFPTLEERVKVHYQIVPDSPYFPVDEPQQPERRARVKKVLPAFKIEMRHKRSADVKVQEAKEKNTAPKATAPSSSIIEKKAVKLKNTDINGAKKLKAPVKRNVGQIDKLNSVKKQGRIRAGKKQGAITKTGLKSQRLKKLRNKKQGVPKNKRISNKHSQTGLGRSKHNASHKKLSKSVRNLKAGLQRGLQKIRNKNAGTLSQDQRNSASKLKARNTKGFNGRRLIASRDATIEEYPYTVSIQKDGSHWCSGALLNPRLIITTANCLWRSNSISRLRVRAGSRHTDRGGQVAKIQEVMKHPGWKLRKNPDNDVALALLDRNIRLSHGVHAVDLPNRVMMPPFDDAWVTSWGAERKDGIYDGRSVNLQVYHARLMDREKCNNVTNRFGVAVNENFICLAQTGSRAPCTRDTGAPAVSDGVLWGLASWGIRKLCGTERFPAMFSYTASHGNMNFLANATRYLMGDERNYPFIDRYPIRQVITTTPPPLILPHKR